MVVVLFAVIKQTLSALQQYLFILILFTETSRFITLFVLFLTFTTLIRIMSRGGRPPSGVDNMYSLKVDNLTYRTSPETLKRAFQKFGDVGDVYIPRDR